MTIFLSIIAFVIIFSAIILVHELGHFFAARISGIQVDEFGLGLPPRIFGKKTSRKIEILQKGKKKQITEKMIWSINAIPFGGFVKMAGEDHDEKEKNNPRAFSNRPVGLRIFTVCAGVLMNFLLGWILLTAVFTIGAKPIFIGNTPEDLQKAIEKNWIEVDNTGIFVADVVENSPAAQRGIEPGDFVTMVDQKTVKSFKEFQAIKEKGMKGKGFHLLVIRKNLETFKTEKTFVSVVVPDENGNLGIYFSDLPPIKKINEVKLPVHKASIFAAEEMYRLSFATTKMLGNIVVSLVKKMQVPEGVGGPVAIAKVTHQFVEEKGLVDIVQFAAILSISIGIINIMPFPALDGGRFLFLLVEAISRRKINPKWESIIHGIGFVLLLIFLFFVTWKDFLR